MKVEVVEVFYVFGDDFATFVVELSEELVSLKMEMPVSIQSYHKYLAARSLIEKHVEEMMADDPFTWELLGMLTYPVAHHEMEPCCKEQDDHK